MRPRAVPVLFQFPPLTPGPGGIRLAAGWLAFSLAALPAAGQTTPTPRTHSEVTASPNHRFVIRMGGTMDGENTRTPIGYSAWSRVFEPMREVRIENIGNAPVVNPWVTVNGRHDWRTVEKIVEEATRGCQNDRERAIAIWRFVIEHRFHATPNDGDNIDPVKQFNVYGYSLCGDIAQTIRQLWKIGSFQTRRGWPHGHCLTEVWFDDGWRMLDGDEQIICLDRDNETIVGETEIVRDHDLMKRTHTYGILAGENPLTDQFSASLHVYEGERKGDYRDNFGHRMDLTLRPGETLIWRWDNANRYHGTNLKTGWGPGAAEPLANGRLVFRPPQVQAAGESVGEALVVPVTSPYVIVGGKLELSGDAKTFVSFDKKNWQAVTVGSLDALFPPEGKPRYRYWLKFDPASALQSFRVENVLQMAPLSLPALTIGNNEVRYQDDTDGSRKVRITIDWQERGDSAPPAAPVAEFPSPEARVEGTQFTFAWTKTGADYHFQLSNRPDLRWPLSPTFDRLISLTPQKGTASWAIPWRGLLNPGQPYHWRVRARNKDGLWGPWSQPFSFTPEGPGVPLKVRFDAATQAVRWEANLKGRPPVKWRVNASDEKGFTASDTAQQVIWESPQDGRPREVQEWPANFIGETAKPEWRQFTHAFYRVVAVDAQGILSGASDYADIPRPKFLTWPITRVKAGTPYRYQPKVIRSLGDLRCKNYTPDKIYWAGYWNVEKPLWSLRGAPEWLRINTETGELSGTPPASAAGTRFSLDIGCEIVGVGADHQSFTLSLER